MWHATLSRQDAHAQVSQHCVPLLQGLAFVGSEVITFNAVNNSALQSEWLAALLQVTLLTACHYACTL